ncbi:MAG: hypothetical protein RJB61_881 [Actinomycetota bacterium]
MTEQFPLAVQRRRTELRLVLMAAVITGAAYVLAAVGKNSQMPARILPFAIALIALLVVAHIAVRKFARGADPALLPVAVLLNGLGYVMIARLSDERAAAQTTWTLIAVGAFVATLLLVPRVSDLLRFKWSFLAASVVLLLLPQVPGLGRSVGGARIWVGVGPISFQPGEFAKIALALFFAAYLSENRHDIRGGDRRLGPVMIPEPRYLLPITAAWGFAVAVMVASKDLGSALLFFTLFTVMLWIATERGFFLVLGTVLFAGAAVIAYQLFDVVRTRVSVWLDPWSQYEGTGYQASQAMFSLASGGTGGTGLGMGSPNKVPAASTDYIFAAIGEELGLLGATAVLVAFLLLIGAGLRIALQFDRGPAETGTSPAVTRGAPLSAALHVDRDFSKLLATGLTTIIGMQAFIITGGVLRLIPLTGITLPFVSYGGSSLLANYILLALLIRLSDTIARQGDEVPDDLSIAERMQRWRERRLEHAESAARARRREAASAGTPQVGARR